MFTVSTLRECFRHLQAFRAVFESEGVDVLQGPDGTEICLWDLETLYQRLDELPPRQHQAIELFLVQNIREDEVAILMGIKPTNPIGLYATSGLEKLVEMIEQQHEDFTSRANGRLIPLSGDEQEVESFPH